MKLAVECRAGYKAEEEPLRFSLDERRLEVIEVCDRWYDPEADYFKVRADDGCLYLLRRDRVTDTWSLRYVRTREPKVPLIEPPRDAKSRVH